MQIGSSKWRFILGTALMLGIGFTSMASARHGEENILTNRIPEPAPYVVSETTSAGGAFGAPHTGQPFEPLWEGINETGGCSGCHTGLYDQWNGAMMSNAWRDPGWRGAFLLVARLTSTDGDCDIPNPPDGTAKAKINPFGNTNCTSTFNNGTATPVTYSGSGSLMDDFCSRCHMPTNYIDGVTNVTADPPSSQEHGRISPLYDPTSINPSATAHPIDPFTGAATPESFGERTYTDGGATRVVNSNSGKIGIICEVCHTNVETRYTPYHNYNKSGTEYVPAPLATARHQQLPNVTQQDLVTEPDLALQNLGYAVGAGAFRLSPHALNFPERFGPLSWNDPCALFPNKPCVVDPFLGQNAVVDPYVTDVFSGGGVSYTGYLTKANPPGKHDTYYQVKFERSEFCAACHDVTNPLTIKNENGHWVGGFPIERTYAEWLSSRYSDRPITNTTGDMKKRDCQTCHMQQSFGDPGTALTLYAPNGITPNAPIREPSCDRIEHNPGYSHHFVGGNGYITRMIGADTNGGGTVSPYPELLHTSFSSANKTSRFAYARYDTTPSRSGPPATQHERFAWDRMRNVVTLALTAPASVAKPASATAYPLTVSVTNDGSGHDFPTGFPEGRIAWVHIKAWDTKNTAIVSDDVELFIRDSAKPAGGQDTLGIGYLTNAEMVDPAYSAACPDPDGGVGGWKIPEGSPDPWAIQFKAVASLGIHPVTGLTCPTLALPYATPINLRTNAAGLPVDAANNVVDRANPTRIPTYNDLDGDGDLYDDSFLVDTRLRPRLKNPAQDLVTNVVGLRYSQLGSTVSTSRYSVVVPPTVVGPIGVTAAVYYQAFEAVVAKKFLGNLANLDDVDANEGYPGGKPTLEPCVLKGACDRKGKPGATGDSQLRDALKFDPIVVEGAPPQPMRVRNAVIQVTGPGTTADTVAPRILINNCKPPRGSTACPGTNMTAPIPDSLKNGPTNNMHWSPSPYGGLLGNFASEGYGELGVAHNRVVKVSFSEPVKGVDRNTFYLTDSGGTAIDSLLDQIDDTTWALFPYSSVDKVFLSGGGYVIHVAPSRTVNNVTYRITDFAATPNQLFPGPAGGGEYTFGFKAQ